MIQHSQTIARMNNPTFVISSAAIATLEIRTIAREVKHLVLRENYDLADIAFVVRQRASYAPTIARVMREESVPCNLELRIETRDVPASPRALKLLDVLEESATALTTPLFALVQLLI